MPAPVIDAIGIVVSDIARSVAFYARFGLDFPAEEVERGDDHVEAAIAGSGVRVMLDSEEMMRGLDPDFEGSVHGRLGLAVRCGSPSEVDALYAELAADGYARTEPWDAPWGQRYAQVADPDGQAVDLYAPLSRPAG